jgi:dihydropteroate synthase
LSFCEKVIERKDDRLFLEFSAAETADMMVNIMNASTTAALTAMHTAMKKTMTSALNDLIDASGKEVLDSFRESVQSGVKK